MEVLGAMRAEAERGLYLADRGKAPLNYPTGRGGCVTWQEGTVITLGGAMSVRVTRVVFCVPKGPLFW